MGSKEIIKPLIKFVEIVPMEEFEACLLLALSTLVNISINGISFLSLVV
jgi:hypothetical protein